MTGGLKNLSKNQVDFGGDFISSIAEMKDVDVSSLEDFLVVTFYV